MRLATRAPAKLNLCLYVGPRRPVGLHEFRSLFQPITRDWVGTHPYPAVVPKFSRTPCVIRSSAPTLGEDNVHVFGTVLGLSPDRIAGLEERNVIGTTPLFARGQA